MRRAKYRPRAGVTPAQAMAALRGAIVATATGGRRAAPSHDIAVYDWRRDFSASGLMSFSRGARLIERWIAPGAIGSPEEQERDRALAARAVDAMRARRNS